MRLFALGILAALTLVTLPIASVTKAHAETAITDDFHMGIYSSISKKVQKSVPVCVWNQGEEGAMFTVTVFSLNTGSQLVLRNTLNDNIDYAVHWLSGKKFKQRERLRGGIPSRRSYSSADTMRCASGPTGMLRVTIDNKQAKAAPPGVYTDTLQLVLSAL